jgi:hypothetical protein
MPNITRTLAKGIPPRLRQPKPAAKKQNKKKDAADISRAKQSKKRVANCDSDEEDESSESDTVKKKPTKKRRTHHEEPEAENEVEMVDNVEPPEPEAEEVDNGGHENLLPDEQQVSIKFLLP